MDNTPELIVEETHIQKMIHAHTQWALKGKGSEVTTELWPGVGLSSPDTGTGVGRKRTTGRAELGRGEGEGREGGREGMREIL